MVLQEGIQAVREKASFLERELREQVAAAHEFMEEERRQRQGPMPALSEPASPPLGTRSSSRRWSQLLLLS